MSTTIIMPQLGESVAEGVIGKWLKREGDSIERDEPIVEVITDKVNAEIPSPVGGVLQRIVQPEGATVAVGQEIAIIGDADGSGSGTAGAASADSMGSGSGESNSARVGSAESGGVPETGDGQGGRSAANGLTGAPSGGRGSVAPVPEGDSPPGGTQTMVLEQSPAGAGSGARANGKIDARGERVRSSPLVRRLAEQYGVDLAEVPGTGIGGRVSKQDILSFIEQKDRAPAAPSVTATAGTAPAEAVSVVAAPSGGQPIAPPGPPGSQPQPRPTPTPTRQPGANEELIPVSPLRKMIADRMTQSVYTIPHASTVVEVDVTNVVRYREAKKDEFRSREGVPLSYVAFVVKATVEALKEHPMANSEWAGDNIIVKHAININVAVDAPDGLTTPVIHGADGLSLAGLSRAIYDLATRARDKKLKIEDMQGGTFTVNNTGALGSVQGVSIINFPQAAILSAAAIVKRPVVVEGDGQDLIAVRSMMNLCLSFDHRVLDGGSASAFLNAVKRSLEAWPADYPLY